MPLKIYYLDDERDLLQTFKDLFESNEVEVTVFDDPKLAVAHTNSHPPDLMFLDYRLPNATGDKIAALISPSIPKALVTGDLHVKLESKFEEVFSKPYSIIEIEAFIAKHNKVKKEV